jgi:hypothetical protein
MPHPSAAGLSAAAIAPAAAFHAFATYPSCTCSAAGRQAGAGCCLPSLGRWLGGCFLLKYITVYRTLPPCCLRAAAAGALYTATATRHAAYLSAALARTLVTRLLRSTDALASINAICAEQRSAGRTGGAAPRFSRAGAHSILRVRCRRHCTRACLLLYRVSLQNTRRNADTAGRTRSGSVQQGARTSASLPVWSPSSICCWRCFYSIRLSPASLPQRRGWRGTYVFSPALVLSLSLQVLGC